MNRPSDSRYIHETALKELIDIWDTIKSMTNDKDKLIKKGSGPLAGVSSLSKAASNLTMVFPVICSRGISIETASMVTKAVEKNAVTLLQRMFAAWQVADTANLQDYMAMFHSNLATSAVSLDDIFRLSDRVIGESVENPVLWNTFKEAVRADMRNLNHVLPDAINENSVNDFIVSETRVELGLNDEQKAKIKKQIEDRKAAEKKTEEFMKKASDNNQASGEEKASDNNQASGEEKASDSKHVSGEEKASSSKQAFGEKKASSSKQAFGSKNQYDLRKSATEYFKSQVPDADYKKANELMPTPMTVSFRVKDDKTNEYSEPFTAVLGIKAKLYPIGSDDIVKHLSEKTHNNNWITNFFRATTREISFMKDFVLGIDKAKIDAMSQSVRKSTSDKMWKVLERRATNSRLRKALRQNNASAAAITTLVVSQEEVETLRKEHNIDLERISTVLGLFSSYSLMCLCIVDESLEVAKFIFDENDPSWETISFTHLERESSDNTYKRVVNLMTKMR